MVTHMTFRHMEATDAIKNYTEGKLEKVKKFVQEPLDIHVVFSKERFQYLVEINLSGNGMDIHAEDRNEDLYAAIDLVMDKIEKQLRRLRDKKKNRKTPHHSRAFKLAVLSPEMDKGEKPRVIKSKAFVATPLSISEAMDELDGDSKDFLVFTNAETSRINVLYKRGDGNFGLIDPTE